MTTPFQSSSNALFHTVVRQVDRLSPGFLRVTVGGDQLHRFAPYGLDQRIKILVPHEGYPAVFDDELLHESEWRRRWRDLPGADRPVLRSYTVSAVRPEHRGVDLDFYVHELPGPASDWAMRAVIGDRLLLSGPDVRLNDHRHGIQWAPGRAAEVLLAGDETAFPAIRGIALALRPAVHARILLEVGDPLDAVWLTDDLAALPGLTVTVHDRGTDSGGSALVRAVEDWTRQHGAAAAAAETGFYAWLATESSQVATLRDLLHRTEIRSDRVHSQGYWNSRARATLG